MKIECSKKEANYFLDGVWDSIEFLQQIEPDDNDEKKIMKQCLYCLKELERLFRAKAFPQENAIIKSMEEGLEILQNGGELPTTFVPTEKVFRMKYSKGYKK